MKKKQWQNKHHVWNHRRTNKEELQQRNHLGTVSRKSTRGGLKTGVVVGLKPVLLMWNLTFNSDAAPDYIYLCIIHILQSCKSIYMFGPLSLTILLKFEQIHFNSCENIYTIPQLQIRGDIHLIFFWFLHENRCCEYSLEEPWWVSTKYL